MLNDSRYQSRSRWHVGQARNYRRQSELLLSRDNDRYAAGALMYEAAKQCVNAVANQRGSNPGTTAAKFNTLHTIAHTESSGNSLTLNWRSVTQLHIHADRGHLTDTEYAEAWEQPAAFIDDMLNIYRRDA